MKQLLFVLGVAILATIGLAYPVYAQCKSADSIMASDDSYLPITNSSINPCDNWLTWDVWFHRNGELSGSTIITFEIHGFSDVYESYDSSELPNNHDYHYSDTKYVGLSSSERMYMGRSGNTSVHFTNIKGRAKFFAKQED
jgi:hypothetical protein